MPDTSLVEDFQPVHHRPITPFRSRESVRIVSLDPDLKSHFGHYLAFEKTLAEECRARGVEFLVLSALEADPDVRNAVEMIPCFDRHSWQPFAKGRFGTVRDLWICSGDYTRRIRRALRGAVGHRPPPQVVLFMYLAHTRHVAAAIRLGLHLRGRHPIVLNLFWAHFSHGSPEKRPDPQFGRFLRATRSLRRLANVHLCVDSDILEERLQASTGEHFRRWPMFSVTDFTAANDGGHRAVRRDGGRIRVTAPTGNMRWGKGVDLVCGLAEEWNRRDVELVLRRVTGGYRDPRLLAIVDRASNATVVDGVLSPGEYAHLLESSDVLLLPYRREEFYSRTSGIFADALELGKPMVGTADTWLGRRIEEYGCGETFRDGDVGDLRHALERVLADLPRYRRRVLEVQAIWRRENNPALAVDFLLSFAR